MKKAKIFLAAMAITSLVGGTLAFKAQKRNLGNLYCSTTYTSLCRPSKIYMTDPIGTTLYCSTTSIGCYRISTVTVDL